MKFTREFFTCEIFARIPTEGFIVEAPGVFKWKKKKTVSQLFLVLAWCMVVLFGIFQVVPFSISN